MQERGQAFWIILVEKCILSIRSWLGSDIVKLYYHYRTLSMSLWSVGWQPLTLLTMKKSMLEIRGNLHKITLSSSDPVMN